MNTPITMTVPVGRFRQAIGSPGGRLAGLALLVLVLMIPLAMIQGRVQERAVRRDEAAADIASSWGGAQTLTGPMLRVPFTQSSTDGSRETKRTSWLVLPPQTLEIEANLDAESRRRSIFEIPVYRTKVRMTGRFALDEDSALPVASSLLDWSRAEVILAVAAPRALGGDSRLEWNEHMLTLEPSATGLSESGVHAMLRPELIGDGAQGLGRFKVDLEVTGSRAFHLAPVARTTHAHIVSDWPHPSFQGEWLPVKSTIDAHGFDASWAVSHLGRGYPPFWVEGEVPAATVLDSNFGLALNVPVDPYRMAERIAKYGALLVVLTFCAVWVMELLGGQPLHAVQYMMLGSSLCLFGLLQLALAEHLGFERAFAVAAGAIVVQASLYAKSATRSTGRALALGTLLTGWFAYLYVVLNAEDYAFLLGTIALFVALTGVMWATRSVDWSGRSKWDVASATIAPVAS